MCRKCADTVAVLIQGRVTISAYVSIPYPVHKSGIKCYNSSAMFSAKKVSALGLKI